MDGKELQKFSTVTAINGAGELVIPAGRYSRGAVICAFEMIGGLEALAGWAEDNQEAFYTKLFGKVIGREVEHKKADDVEDILKVLDGEATDITDVEIIEEVPPREAPLPVVYSALRLKMMRRAAEYADGEPAD